MARLKLNLPTGVAVEKSLITAFNVDNKTYLVLDAENIGSMGLPIILVCKLENDRVVKIVDPTEWQQAKNYLKGIIAGNSMNYIEVASELAADEVYYTQLTLPVASFDLIKNAYTVSGNTNVESDSITPTIPEPVVQTPAVNEQAPIPDVPVISDPVVPDAPVIPEVPVTPEVPETPAVEPIINDSAPVMPEIPSAPVDESPVTPETNQVDFSDTKEAFMKACENMFDALVTKFQDQINNK